MLSTPLCAILGIDHPVLNAPMAGTATADLAASRGPAPSAHPPGTMAPMTDTAEPGRLYFRQLLAGRDIARNDPLARQMVNFVYLIGDRETGEAIAVDPAYDIAGLTHGQLHVISAHPSPMLSAADPTFQLSETIEARYREACKAFQAEYGVDDQHLHIEEGPADVLIPRTAHQLDAAVTVIGTVARTGFSGALIGNTAEVVLDALESDVLVLKPDEVIAHLDELAAKA